MKILIAVASKHGSTREIADAIAEELRTADYLADVRDVREAGDVGAYDAVIVGSAVFLGKWMTEARKFVEANREQLSSMPVWLFSSGPIIFRNRPDEHATSEDDPSHLDELLDSTHAREHRVFGGKLDRNQLNLGERLAVRAAKAADGDYRDWEEIRGWARDIAHELASATVSPA